MKKIYLLSVLLFCFFISNSQVIGWKKYDKYQKFIVNAGRPSWYDIVTNLHLDTSGVYGTRFDYPTNTGYFFGAPLVIGDYFLIDSLKSVYEIFSQGLNYRNIFCESQDSVLNLYRFVNKSLNLTINGSTFNLATDRNWIVGDVFSSNHYNNPSFIDSLAFSKIKQKPNTLGAYGITDGVTTSTLASSLAGKANSFAGTSTEYIKGNGTYGTFPTSLSSFSNSFTKYLDSTTALGRFKPILYTPSSGDINTALGFTVMQIPSLSGQSNKVLSNNGSLLNWITPGSGTVSSVGIVSTDFRINNSPITSSGNITLNLKANGITAGKYNWVIVDTTGRVTSGINMGIPSSLSAGSRVINVTGVGSPVSYQPSTTGATLVAVAVSCQVNIVLTGNSTGTVFFEVSSDNSIWINIAPICKNVASLIGLTTVNGAAFSYTVPKSWYYRLRSLSSTTGIGNTATFTFEGGSEAVY